MILECYAFRDQRHLPLLASFGGDRTFSREKQEAFLACGPGLGRIACVQPSDGSGTIANPSRVNLAANGAIPFGAPPVIVRGAEEMRNDFKGEKINGPPTQQRIENFSRRYDIKLRPIMGYGLICDIFWTGSPCSILKTLIRIRDPHGLHVISGTAIF